MTTADLYIVAAGKGSRMNAGIPKALIQIAGEPCLTTTLKEIAHKFVRVFVVSNSLMLSQWESYFELLHSDYPDLAARVINLPIDSGLGDGHATLAGLLAAEKKHPSLSRDVVISWGDVFFPHAELIDELLSALPRGAGLLPAALEPNPYVSLSVDESMRCIAAEFSRYGESRPLAFHDQSVFRFELFRLRRCLRHLHNALWKGNRYIAPGGELSLLYTFHQFYNSADPVYVYETSYRTRPFNTPGDIAEIEKELRFYCGQPLRHAIPT